MVDDDNDSSTFRPLAIAVASVLSKIEQGKPNEANSREEHDRERQQTERSKQEQLRYVDRRIREIAAFEKRVNGGKGFKR